MQSELAMQKSPTPNVVFSFIFGVRYEGIRLDVDVGNIVGCNIGKKIGLLVGSPVRRDVGLQVGANEVDDVAFGVQVGERVVTVVGAETGINVITVVGFSVGNVVIISVPLESSRLDGSDDGNTAGYQADGFDEGSAPGNLRKTSVHVPAPTSQQ